MKRRVLVVLTSSLFALNCFAGPTPEQSRRMKEARMTSQSVPFEVSVTCRSGKMGNRHFRPGHANFYPVTPYSWRNEAAACANDNSIEITGNDGQAGTLN
jgi:hypothetical protein